MFGIPPAEVPQPRLDAIFNDRAFIDGQWLRLGEITQEWRLQKIWTDRVILQKDAGDRSSIPADLKIKKKEQNAERFYEADGDVDGRRGKISLFADGRIQTKRPVELSEIPPIAIAAGAKDFPQAPLGKYERIRDSGRTVYRIEVRGASKENHRRVNVSTTGEITVEGDWGPAKITGNPLTQPGAGKLGSANAFAPVQEFVSLPIPRRAARAFPNILIVAQPGSHSVQMEGVL